MIELQITPDLDQAPWVDLRGAFPSGMGVIERIGRLPRGTHSGRSVVAVVIRMPDGTRCIAETTLELFSAAAKVMRTRDEMEKAPDN
ncbi:MAG TPA: hypothetical protein VEB66_02385 [Opitutaceae bacterium]|nr:hypothetical protein [Opitutaceae bacterium]